MANEKEQFEERTVTLKVTKTRGEVPEEYQTELEGGGNCADWFLEKRDGKTYNCRWCATQGPTAIPYKECVEQPT